MGSPIDFVITWVDGDDPEWRMQKEAYKGETYVTSNSCGEVRYRNWDLLRYWFRGVELNTPWVNRIHFVTCGHLPAWLNIEHPKINIVFHKDYMPSECLPTFSSHGIELMMNRIPGLSEHFVYFNDDFYLLSQANQQLFFHNGIPCSGVGLGVSNDFDLEFYSILQHTLQIINKNFRAKEVRRKQWYRFLHPNYGIRKNIQTLLLFPWLSSFIPGFTFNHGPDAYLRSTLDKVWGKEEKILMETCRNRFRNWHDVNHFVFRWWQWCEGNFYPIDERKRYSCLSVSQDIDIICRNILSPQAPVLVLNDEKVNDFEYRKKRIQDAFQQRFPDKCSYEI